MWLKLFSIIPAVAEMALLLMAKNKSITAIVDAILKLVGIAAPRANLPASNRKALATWGERTIADGVITSTELIDLAKMMNVKLRIDGPIKS